MLTAEELIAFEREVADVFESGLIRSPIHLSGSNERELIEIFKDVRPEDWVLATWRSHYHALLKGVPRERVMAEILAGRSMALNFPEHRFLTSAIMGGILPIACGLAAAGERVWCFVGDMCASTGAFADAARYAGGHRLPLVFVVEDNGLSVGTPTAETWGTAGPGRRAEIHRYEYERAWPHVGCGVHVAF